MMAARNYLFNPLQWLPDRFQSPISLLIMIFAWLIGYGLGSVQDGIYHVTFLKQPSALLVELLVIAAFYLPVFLLYITGKLFNKKTRFSDVWNGFAFSMVPLLLANILSFFLLKNEDLAQLSAGELVQAGNSGTMLRMVVLGVVGLGCLIYSFLLLVNGYKTATNAKKALHYGWMVLAIIVAELLYRSFIYPYLIQFF